LKLPEGSPFIIYILVNELGLSYRQANLIAGAIYIGTMLLLISICLVFMEWRFVQFEQLGCAAYCNCTARMGNITYTF